MSAIFRRELSAYFHSPIGYVFLTVFYLFAGFYFFAGSIVQDVTDLGATFASMFTISLFLIPILTMRLFSDEKKQKTDQALLTAPVSITSIVLGKYFAAVVMFVCGLAITLVYSLFIAIFAPPVWSIVFGNFLSLLLLGMSLISIGMFISALTENQVIAAIGGFAIGLFLLLIDSLRTVTANPVFIAIIDAVSFYNRYSDYSTGLLSLSSTFYFLSASFIFCFLTVRVYEKRRWA